MIHLRPYQAEIMKAVAASVMQSKGLTLSVEIARQGGKNEVSAQLEVMLLTIHMGAGGNIIKCSPTFKPQTVISMQRLKERLTDWGYQGFYGTEMGYIVSLGNARAIFLSADESANVVGNTAHILLEIDESQDVGKEKYTKEFKPMGATTNVTTVHYGTTWDDSTLLEETKQANLELERKDGIKRHFRYDWKAVAEHNPEYRAYVESERARLGADHPLYLTQYCLQPIRGGGRFFSQAQLAQLQGRHARRLQPDHTAVYIAGLDLAGEAEQIDDIMLEAVSPARDATVLTIGEVIWNAGTQALDINAVQSYQWIGVPHPAIYQQLVDLLKHSWNVARVVVDATGIGEPVASYLAQTMKGKAVPFKFTQKSKSELGFNLLAAVNSGRLKIYARDNTEECGELWKQLQLAKSVFRPNQTMNFFVEPSEGHDDHLMSNALLVEASRDYTPRIAKGRTK